MSNLLNRLVELDKAINAAIDAIRAAEEPKLNAETQRKLELDAAVRIQERRLDALKGLLSDESKNANEVKRVIEIAKIDLAAAKKRAEQG